MGLFGRRLSARFSALFVIFFAILFIAACATPTEPNGLNSLKNGLDNEFNGRISLVIQSEPSQSFAGGFSLLGNPQEGQMTLTTPLGNVAAQLRWQPGMAVLQSGGGQQQYPSVQAMLLAATGAAVPIDALFAWLRGEQVTAPGWLADTSQSSRGRISAQRSDPQPGVVLRIVLEP